MKKLFILALALGMATATMGQKAFILSRQDKPGFLAVSVGASLPVGQFASCAPTDDPVCIAGEGIAFTASIGYRFAGPLGLMVRGEQHRNSVNTSAMLNALYQNDSNVWTAKVDNWSILNVMAGPYISVPMGRFSVDARLLAGRALAVLPSTTMAGMLGTTETLVKTTGAQSTALSLGGGMSVRYRLSPHMSLFFNADYSRADFTFTDLISTVTTGTVQSQSARYSSRRLVSVVSASAGIAVLFGNRYHPF